MTARYATFFVLTTVSGIAVGFLFDTSTGKSFAAGFAVQAALWAIWLATNREFA